MTKWKVGDRVPLHIVGTERHVSSDGSRIGVDWPEPLCGSTVHVAEGKAKPMVVVMPKDCDLEVVSLTADSEGSTGFGKIHRPGGKWDL